MTTNGGVSVAFDLYECQKQKFLTSASKEFVEAELTRLVRDSGFSLIDSGLRLYSKPDHVDHEGHGYTLYFIIGESGGFIHTYPERGTNGGTVQLDLTYCNLDRCIDDKANRFLGLLVDFFKPETVKELPRVPRALDRPPDALSVAEWLHMNSARMVA